MPALPQVYLNTSYSQPTGKIIRVVAGGDLQAALDMAQPGDEVRLAPGATFTGSFTLPAKAGAGAGAWIVVRPDVPDGSLPPEGTRLDPRKGAVAALLPKLVTTDVSPAVQAAPGARYWRLIGLEIAAAPVATQWGVLNYRIVELGAGTETSVSQVPSDIILDRVYIHGAPNCECKRGIALNSAATAVIDSWIDEIHGTGQDTQAILGWNGPGPFKIVNNYLAASGENVMFGGADPAIPNLVPSDIELRRNHFYKPPAWRGVWQVKNLLELKAAQRVLVEGNVFENSWPDAQDGFALVLWSANQSGACTWCVTADVTVRYNWITNAAAGFQLSDKALNPSPVLQRVLIAHNLLTRIGGGAYGGAYGGKGWLYQLAGGMADLQLVHNTGLAPEHLFYFVSTPLRAMPRLVIRDNVAGGAQYKVFSSYGEGTAVLTAVGGGGAGPVVFAGNVITGAAPASYPANNFYPAQVSQIGFQDLAAGDYTLSPASPYKAKASDGTDPGADIAALRHAIAHVREGH
jgi:hypothetical protein